MTTDDLADYAIIGGGCAGLSLAVGLAERLEPTARIVLVEPRTTYQRDRTWCYWRVRPHRFEAAVSHAWNRWKIRHNGREIIRESHRYPYQHIPADAFYHAALERLAAAPNVTLKLGVTAQVITAASDSALVETDHGRLKARHVFDSRPPKPLAGSLLQHFVGWRVQTATPYFSPATLTLMDFDVPQDDGIHFFYVLPYSPCEALVEATFISSCALPEAHYQTAIQAYLAERYNVTEFDILEQERGVIPMSAARLPLCPAPRIYRIGTAGGLIKGSSGYGFLPMQYWTEKMVQRLAVAELPEPPAPRSPLARWFDRVFLSYISHFPEQAPALFFRLFNRADSQSLIRFMSEQASYSDYSAVIRAMPALPFMRETLRWQHSWRAS